MQYRGNVTHVKKYFERDYAVLPATSKSTMTQSLREQHKVYQTKSPENL